LCHILDIYAQICEGKRRVWVLIDWEY